MKSGLALPRGFGIILAMLAPSRIFGLHLSNNMKAYKGFIRFLFLTNAMAALCVAHRSEAVVTNDLRADWSDAQNPNGVWSYNERTNALPHTSCAFQNCSELTNCQPAWGRGNVCPTQGGSTP